VIMVATHYIPAGLQGVCCKHFLWKKSTSGFDLAQEVKVRELACMIAICLTSNVSSNLGSSTSFTPKL